MKSFIKNENKTRKLSQQMHSILKKSLKKQFYYIRYLYLLYTKYHNFQSETQNTLTSIKFHVLKLTVFNKIAFNSPSLYFTCDFSVVALC